VARRPGPRLTIGQAASYAGVTTRAIRHYHQVGLLAEPGRDSSGYRRYSARDVIDLIRIRALTKAGVPLNRIGALLTAGLDEFAAAVAEIDQQLQAEIRRLEEHRVAVAQLATVDGLALPTEVVAYLDHLRALGFGERMIAIERDGWLIISAQLPDAVVGWIEAKRESFDDPQIVAAYRALEAAFDWGSNDPRLDDLADLMERLFVRTASEQDSIQQPPVHAPEIDSTTVAMLDAESIARSPAWVRLGELLEQRGWHGWNDLEGPMKHVPPNGEG
jgi:DNA-binding transcriptional MerR regulator